MTENPYLTVGAEQQQVQMEMATTPLPPLWTQLEHHRQKQIAQLLAELIRRCQRQTVKQGECSREQ